MGLGGSRNIVATSCDGRAIRPPWTAVPALTRLEPYDGLRRIQFDVERDRHVTLVLVPDRAAEAPQVLVIPPHQYEAVGQAIAVIGRRFAESSN